jgi:hypothetical protein
LPLTTLATMPNTLYYDALLSSLFLMSIAFLFLLVCSVQHWSRTSPPH